MRIISGKLGGRKIIAPSSLPVRPTTDFAKTGLFNILNNYFDFENISVLDLFGGTGNISLEFASRGTTQITCVDEHSGCVKFIKEISQKLNVDSIHTIHSEVFEYLDQCKEKFDIVFADPPYESETTHLLPDLIIEKGIVNQEGWIIIEHQSKQQLKSKAQPWQVRKYGNCAISIYKLVHS
jgi:16S rRNA (guanine966-N2)-methyltransferase